MKELYEFYERFRDDTKLKWTDIKDGNIGMLLKDNQVYWNEPLYNDDKTLGLEEYRRTKKLRAGDLVILDSDYMYDEKISDDKISKPDKSFYEQFEFEYQGKRKCK